jgi:hypothetical protein
MFERRRGRGCSQNLNYLRWNKNRLAQFHKQIVVYIQIGDFVNAGGLARHDINDCSITFGQAGILSFLSASSYVLSHITLGKND